MRRLALCAALASLVALTGCGGGEEDDTAAPQPSASLSASASAVATASPSAAPAATPTRTLFGSIGTTDDPDAFVIDLTDASGQKVTTLPAGQYEIQVKDPSKIHNFHLQGKGVDESTTVPEVTETSFTVTLTAGTYEYVCDPHPSMVGEITVT